MQTKLFLGSAFAVLLSLLPAPSMAQEGRLGVELNKVESIEGGCRTFFLFRNRTDAPFDAFEMSLAILDANSVIDRLLTVEAAPLPPGRTTLKLFEIPEIGCENISEILMHDIAKCESGGGPKECFPIVDLTSRAAPALVK